MQNRFQGRELKRREKAICGRSFNEERGFRVDSYWETEWEEWFETQPESKEDSSYWDDESDDDEDRVRTHPLLDAARARWAREDAAPKPRRRVAAPRRKGRKSLEGL